MNKKGDEKLSKKLIVIAAILLICGLVIYGMFKFVGNAINDTTFWRHYYAKDIGMMSNMLQADRGTFELEYSTEKSPMPLVLSIDKYFVELHNYDPKTQNPEKTTYRLFGDEKIALTPIKELVSTFLNFASEPAKFQVSETSIKTSGCNQIDTKASPTNPAKVFVSSDSNFGDFADNVRIGLGGLGPHIRIETNKWAQNKDLSIIFMKEDHRGIIVYYDHNIRKSEKLACLIKNALAEKFPDRFFIFAMKEVPPDYELKRVLEESEVGIVISLKETSFEMAVPIVDGVREYYG